MKKKRNIIETPTLTIKDNIIHYKDSIIQIDNISKCDIAPEPKTPYPLWLFVCSLVGFILLFGGSSTFIILGILLITTCCVIFYTIYTSNADPDIYFIIELNSGNIILFSSRDKKFLWSAKDEIIKCFNKNRAECTINFSDCTISHSQIGEQNSIYNKGEAK